MHRRTGDAGVGAAGGGGDASATSVRHAVLLARRALAINAEAARTAREERDAAREELRVGAEFDVTPLEGAAHYGSADCVRLLLEAGADPDLA